MPTMGHGVRFGTRALVSVVMESHCEAPTIDESYKEKKKSVT